MDVLKALHVHAHGVGGAGVLSHRPQPQAGGGAVEIPPGHNGDDHAQIDQHVVAEQALADEGQLGQAGDGQIGKAVFDAGIVVHGGPLDGLQAVAHEEIYAQAKGGQGQAGDVLVGLERDGEGGKQQPAQGPGQKGGEDADEQTVGVAADDIAEDGAHGHDALHAQVQAARLLHHDLPHRAVQQRDVIDHNVVNEGGDHPQLIHFHCRFPLSSREPL